MSEGVRARGRGAPGRDARGWALAAAGVALVALYALGTARIPLPRYFPGDLGITLDFVKMLDGGPAGDSLRYAGYVLAAFALYGVAVAAAWRPGSTPPRWLLFGFPVAFAAALLLMYPPTAVDMFHYHADARTLWVHGENPLTVPPEANPYPIAISWADQPSPYGPFWQLLAALPVLLVPREALLAELVGLKVLASATYLGCTWLIWLLVRRTRPGHEALAVVLFAWNPFVLLATVGNGHNDLAMMLFALLALERAQRRRWSLAFAALTLSVLIKYTTALLGPPLLLYAWTQTPGRPLERARALAPAMALSAVLVVGLYAPFWEGAATFETLRGEADKWITSTPVAVRALLDDHTDGEAAQRTARLVTSGLFLALYVPLAWASRRDFDRLVAGGFVALFLYLLIAVTWFRPWYFLWPLALAALRPRSWLGVVLVVTALAASFPSLVEQYRLEVIEADWDDLSAVAVAFVPPAVAWLVGVARTRSWTLTRERPPTAEARAE